jgi:transcription initiation factor TFIIF subunit beta
MDEDDLYEEDPGDLDFSQAQQQLWLSHIPRSLWETWSSISDDEEIDIGTIRVEGMETDPRRVCTSHPPEALSVRYVADNLH